MRDRFTGLSRQFTQHIVVPLKGFAAIVSFMLFHQVDEGP
jgi:hypothetical protein